MSESETTFLSRSDLIKLSIDSINHELSLIQTAFEIRNKFLPIEEELYLIRDLKLKDLITKGNSLLLNFWSDQGIDEVELNLNFFKKECLDFKEEFDITYFKNKQLL